MNMSTANNSSLIVDQLVTYADWFFPGEIEFDRDLDLGILNGTETSTGHAVGMRRCVSNSSLSDHNDSPPQGSPKPATRRKNKPAPTPPNVTPDKHDKHVVEKHESKPPPAPDKPPRPLATATLNRATYKAQKHAEVTSELVHHEKRDKKLLMSKSSSESLEKSDDKTTEKEHEVTTNSMAKSVEAIKKEPEEVEEEKKEASTPIGFEALRESVRTQLENIELQMPSEDGAKPPGMNKPRPVAAPRNPANITSIPGDENWHFPLFFSSLDFFFLSLFIT